MNLLPAQNKKTLPWTKVNPGRLIDRCGVGNESSPGSRSHETTQFLLALGSQERKQSTQNSSHTPRNALIELAQIADWPIIDFTTLSQAEKVALDLSYEFLKAHKIVPFHLDDDRLCVAVSDPYCSNALQAIHLRTGYEVIPHISQEENILRKIEMDYGLGRGGLDSLLSGFEAESNESGNLDDLGSEAPAIRLFNFLLGRAVDMGASDIHVEPEENELRVRMRVDGVLHDLEPLSKRIQPALTSRIKIMAKLNIAERRKAQDGKIGLTVGGQALDLRVSTLPTVHGEGVVIRLLFRDTLGRKLDDLGMPLDVLERIISLIQRPYGLILVTGPTGSGKTTTLYAALRQLVNPNNKIITVEDPVEYRIPGVTQIQVNPQVGLTFASGLRSIVRQDPDVILVGEIRDRETADIAIHAALTGHLVFATLHTNDAPSAVTRLQDMGVDSFLISSAVTAVLAQRLVRVLCEKCKESATFNGGYGFKAAKKGDSIWRAKGCPDCVSNGYLGRRGIFELMDVDEPLRELINQKDSSDALRACAIKQGMRTLREDGWIKAINGITSLEEILRVTT